MRNRVLQFACQCEAKAAMTPRKRDLLTLRQFPPFSSTWGAWFVMKRKHWSSLHGPSWGYTKSTMFRFHHNSHGKRQLFARVSPDSLGSLLTMQMSKGWVVSGHKSNIFQTISAVGNLSVYQQVNKSQGSLPGPSV